MPTKKRNVLNSVKATIKPARPRRARKAQAQRLKPFNAAAWCGVFPNLAGDSVRIQRAMRDE